MATPSSGRPQLQPLGVLLPGTTTELFFRLDGRALWRMQRDSSMLGWTDTGLAATVVYEAVASLTQLIRHVEQLERRLMDLEAENAALHSQLDAAG
ncbi:MAG TPA: hypothetical protein VGS80_08200 [Ktedonobacterales bacterium]|nr:hypothetical protein [Ktedonobacterales bacterium]